MEANSCEAAGEVRIGSLRVWVWLQFWMCSRMLPWVAMYLMAVVRFWVFSVPKVLFSMLVILRFSRVCLRR